MVRRIKVCAALVALLLLLPVLALASQRRVIDDAGLFRASEVQQMEAVIERIQKTYQMDVVVLTSDEPRYNDTQDFADLYYERGGYGFGEDQAGLLYLIDMNNRVPCISTTGAMADYITDHRLEELFDCSYDELAAGRYGASTLTLLNRLERFLREGREEGSFRYDAETGVRYRGVYNKLTSGEIAFGLIAGLAAALILWGSVVSRYTLKGGACNYSTADHVKRELTVDTEQYLRQVVTRHRTPPPSSGGSGGGHGGGSGSAMHTSSSGHSHGGGVGRGF